MNTHADEKSDEGIVPEKRPNKGGLPPAEAVEERTSPKGNGGQAAAAWTQSQGTASNGLAAVRQAAQRNKQTRFTALLHHITIDLLRESFYALVRNAAPGIDTTHHSRPGRMARPNPVEDLHLLSFAS